MDTTQWFHDQLLASADSFVWGSEQVPSARQNIIPPDGLGEWTAARQVFHLGYYERTFALPHMRQWCGDARPPTSGLNEDAIWKENQANVERLVADFRKVRMEQVALLSKFNDNTWNTALETVWGTVTLRWVVSKTYQHTMEHTSNILRIALFWDTFTARQKAKG